LTGYSKAVRFASDAESYTRDIARSERDSCRKSPPLRRDVRYGSEASGSTRVV
jgi:hypothetical protein